MPPDINIRPDPVESHGEPLAPNLIISSPIDGPTGRTVDSRPGTGGRSVSEVTAGRDFSAELEGPLSVGRPNERQVVKTLFKRMKADGRNVALRDDAEDARGEDGALDLDEARVAVQVVALGLGSTTWRDLATDGKASATGSPTEIVHAVRAAFEHKRGKAAGTILALDATHTGAVVGPELIVEYVRSFGDPEAEFDLLEAWIVGPTIQHCRRFHT